MINISGISHQYLSALREIPPEHRGKFKYILCNSPLFFKHDNVWYNVESFHSTKDTRLNVFGDRFCQYSDNPKKGLVIKLCGKNLVVVAEWESEEWWTFYCSC